MEAYRIDQISHRRDPVVVTLKMEDQHSMEEFDRKLDRIFSLMLHEKVNADSIAIVRNNQSYLFLTFANKARTRNLKIKLRQYGCEVHEHLSTISVQGTGTRGVGGLVARILNEFARKKVNIELMHSGTTEYDFYIDRRVFDKAFACVLRTLGLPGISFS